VGVIVDGDDDGMVVVGLTVGDVGDSVGNDVGDIEYSQLKAIEEEPESLELSQAPLYAYI
jgi:hypothetical protein